MPCELVSIEYYNRAFFVFRWVLRYRPNGLNVEFLALNFNRSNQDNLGTLPNFYNRLRHDDGYVFYMGTEADGTEDPCLKLESGGST